jgi:hypothetical protein
MVVTKQAATEAEVEESNRASIDPSPQQEKMTMPTGVGWCKFPTVQAMITMSWMMLAQKIATGAISCTSTH